MTSEQLPRRDKHLDMRKDIREALTPYLDNDAHPSAAIAVTQAVLPHFELAYKRGQEAGSSRAGYRVVQENERLRRELELAKRGERA